MWAVKLVDIAGDGLVTDFSSTLDTLAEVEILVTATICQKLGCLYIRLDHVDDLVYSVWLNGHEIGVVAIKDVNPASMKRK